MLRVPDTKDIIGKLPKRAGIKPAVIRMGIVDSVDTANNKVMVKIGTDTTAVPARYLGWYTPTAGHAIWLMDSEPTKIVLGTLAPDGAITGGTPTDPDIGEIRYVALSGSDANTGKSWTSAKRTVAAAAADLETINGEIHGTIYVAAGNFIETQPIIASNTMRLFGQGPDSTRIELGHDGHLIDWHVNYTESAHFTIISDLQLHGGGRVGPYDLLRIREGGYNTAVYNTWFTGAPRYGCLVDRNSFNFYMFNCSGDDCVSGFLRLQLYEFANLCQLGLIGTQIDRCGTYPLQFIDSGPGSNTVFIQGLETETHTIGDTQHMAVVYYEPVAGSNGIRFNVDSATVYKAGGGGTSAIYEAAGAGGASSWDVRHLALDGYPLQFKSDKTNTTVAKQKFVVNTDETRVGGDIELRGTYPDQKLLRVLPQGQAHDSAYLDREGRMWFGNWEGAPDVYAQRLWPGILRVRSADSRTEQFNLDVGMENTTLYWHRDSGVARVRAQSEDAGVDFLAVSGLGQQLSFRMLNINWEEIWTFLSTGTLGSALTIYSNGNPLFTLHANGDLEVGTVSRGLILTSPNGSKYRVTVDDTGALSTALA